VRYSLKVQAVGKYNCVGIYHVLNIYENSCNPHASPMKPEPSAIQDHDGIMLTNAQIDEILSITPHQDFSRL
jgi:hypothetical protein